MKKFVDRKLIGYIFFSSLTFSTMEVALKIGGNTLDPLQITLVRFMIGGLVLLPLAILDLRKRQVIMTKSDYLYMGGLGVLCICVGMLCFQMAVLNANASTVAVVFSINPMFTMMFAHFFTDEKMNRRKCVALAVSLVGILIMMNPFHLAPGNTGKGIVFTLISALAFGLYSALGKRRIKRLGGYAQTSIGFILGSLCLAVIVIIMGRPIVAGIGTHNMLNVLYVSVVVTGIGYLLYFKAIEVGGAAKASVVFFLKPVIAPIIALAILQEAISIQIILGVSILLIGSYINMTDGVGTAVKSLGEDKEDYDRGNENCGAG